MVPAAPSQRRHRAAGRLVSLGERTAAEPRDGRGRYALTVLLLDHEPSSG
ncbi:hypothetical protein [Streptomyces caniferus]